MPRKRKMVPVAQRKKHHFRRKRQKLDKDVEQNTVSDPAVESVMENITDSVANEESTCINSFDHFTNIDFQAEVTVNFDCRDESFDTLPLTGETSLQMYVQCSSSVLQDHDYIYIPEESADEIQTTNIKVQTLIQKTKNAKTQTDVGSSLLQSLGKRLQSTLDGKFIVSSDSQKINIIELYNNQRSAICIKLSICIDSSFKVRIFVHSKEVPKDNDIWQGLPVIYDTVQSVEKLLARLKMFTVCIGNPDDIFHDITPIGRGIIDSFSNQIRCIREGDFGAMHWDKVYSSTIRSVKCQLLAQGARCRPCADDRRMLMRRHKRAEERKTSPPVNYVHRQYKHKDMTRALLVMKIDQQKAEMKTMSSEISKLKRQLHSLNVLNDSGTG